MRQRIAEQIGKELRDPPNVATDRFGQHKIHLDIAVGID